MSTCHICRVCHRPLDVPADPLSIDSGGECRKCLLILEHDLPFQMSDEEVLAFSERRRSLAP